MAVIVAIVVTVAVFVVVVAVGQIPIAGIVAIGATVPGATVVTPVPIPVSIPVPIPAVIAPMGAAAMNPVQGRRTSIGVAAVPLIQPVPLGADQFKLGSVIIELHDAAVRG
jgi:hypothetical protein